MASDLATGALTAWERLLTARSTLYSCANAQPCTSPQPTVHLASVQVWYGVPAHASEALEEAMRDALPHLFEAAPSLMYQLVTMLSPTQLKGRGVPVCRLVHQEGSFVITFPNAYHAGFNTGGLRAACAACPSLCSVSGRVSCMGVLWVRRKQAVRLHGQHAQKFV